MTTPPKPFANYTWDPTSCSFRTRGTPSLARDFCDNGAEFPREGALSNPELNALF